MSACSRAVRVRYRPPRTASRRRRRARATCPSATSRSRWPSTSESVRIRLRDRDVAPHLAARSRTRVSGPSAEHAAAPCAPAARASGSARRSARRDRRSARRGRESTSSRRQLARGAHRLDVVDQRVRALRRSRRRRSSGREISGLEEMCASRWSPREQDPPLLVPEDRVRRAVARAVQDAEACGRAASASSPSCSGARDLAARAERPERGADRAEHGRQVVGDAVPAHDRLRELVVGGGAGARSSAGTAEQRGAPRPRRPSGGRGSRAGRGGPCAGG